MIFVSISEFPDELSDLLKELLCWQDIDLLSNNDIQTILQALFECTLVLTNHLVK